MPRIFNLLLFEFTPRTEHHLQQNGKIIFKRMVHHLQKDGSPFTKGRNTIYKGHLFRISQTQKPRIFSLLLLHLHPRNTYYNSCPNLDFNSFSRNSRKLVNQLVNQSTKILTSEIYLKSQSRLTSEGTKLLN